MLGLFLTIFLLIAPLVLGFLVLYTSAKLVKSSRSTLRRTALAMVWLTMIEMATVVVNYTFTRLSAPQSSASSDAITNSRQTVIYLLFSLVVLIISIVADFQVLKRVYKLSTFKAFILFGVWFGTGLVFFAFVVFLVRPYLVEAFVVPTHTMIPAVDVGDRILANKLEKPRRGDVVVYRGEKRVAYCKRLVGMPGDQIRVADFEIYVNGAPTPYRPPAGAPRYPDLSIRLPPFYVNNQTITLGQNDYFMVGDNLQASYDSRFLGPSHKADLIGVVDFTYWPLRRFRLFR